MDTDPRLAYLRVVMKTIGKDGIGEDVRVTDGPNVESLGPGFGLGLGLGGGFGSDSVVTASPGCASFTTGNQYLPRISLPVATFGASAGVSCLSSLMIVTTPVRRAVGCHARTAITSGGVKDSPDLEVSMAR